MASQTRSLSPPPAPSSPYSLTKHNDEFNEHTTSGRTYEELVQQFGVNEEESTSSLDESNECNDHRKSIGCFLTGRNSISNWTTFANNESMDEDAVDVNVPMSSVKGGEVRVSSLETPMIARMDSSMVNVSQRSKRGSEKRWSSNRKDVSARPSGRSMNLSHISSSSSSLGDDVLGESWSPIRSNMENASKRSLSKSPMRSSTRMGRSKSPKKSPTRSPLADISPNRSRGQSPKKSPLKSSLKEALSPNGTYSLKEAEGIHAEATISSKTAKSHVKSKLVLPALGRKYEASSLFSPEKTSTGIHERSPVPTPNSQRRVIKRLRASFPTEENIDEDEVMKEKKEVQKAETEQSAVHKNQTSTLPLVTYENEFQFPSISRPRDATVAVFYKEAIAKGPCSQQYQLKVAGTNCISMQEVILPAIAYDTNEVLKKLQSKAKRNMKDGMDDSKGKEVVDVIDTCRLVLKKCTSRAIVEAGKSWRNREEQRQQALLEQHAEDKEKQKLMRAQAKLNKKQERALAKQQSYERQRYEKQKSHPRNKKMWQEVAKLMMEIQKLEKEESLWKAALSEVKTMEKNYQPPEKMDLASLDDAASLLRAKKQEELCHAVENAQLETKCTTMVQDVTVATERISWMLQSVSLAMNESDRLRQEAYEKYQYEGHKFYGYQTGDAKGLFSALSMDDSFAC